MNGWKTEGYKCVQPVGLKGRRCLTAEREGVDRQRKCGEQVVNNKLAG